MEELEGQGYPALTDGQSVGHYQIEKKIGSGGMGDVYLAVDQRLNRPVALKTLQPEFFDETDKVQRFAREAVTAARINHPNIMSIYDVGETEIASGRKLNYIIMEYIEGQLLGPYVTENKPVFSDILRICEKLASALAAAHKMGIIHRDIKMGNVMINTAGEPKILDFGLAKPFAKSEGKKRADGGAAETITRELTEESKIVGTVSYMSPEQARGEEVDHRSDIFSFGIMLYYLFTGRLPFDGDDRVSTIAKILEAPHEPLKGIDGSLPSELERIVNKCLQKKQDDRYQDTRDLVVDLRSLRRQFDSNISESISGVYDSSRQQPKQGRKIAGVPLLIALPVLAAIAILVIWGLIDFSGSSPGQSGDDQRNTLAILSFENLSDPDDADRYGQIMQELVLTDLSDNTPMQLISSQRLFDIQKKLGYQGRSEINREIATEVARESGARIMLSGNLIQTGDKWIVTCQLIEVDGGTILKSHRLEGTDIFNIVDDLAGRVRGDLTESMEAGEAVAADLSVREKTSVSMDAFRHYLYGVDLLGDTEYKRAIVEFEKAIEIDPEFNKAYYKLAIAQWWVEDVGSDAGKKSINDILDKKRYTSERERVMAIGALALIEHNYEQAIQHYQQLTDQYPDDKEAWYGLGEALYHFDEQTREDALTAFERAIDLDVGFVLAYRHVFDLYYQRARYEIAFEKAQNLIDLKPESSMGYRYQATTAIYAGDSAQIENSIVAALKHITNPVERSGLYNELFFACTNTGNLSRALEFLKLAQETNPQMRDSQRVRMWGELIRLFEATDQPERADSLLDYALASDIALDRKYNMISMLAQGAYGNINTREKARMIVEKGLAMESAGSSVVILSVAGQLALYDRDYERAREFALMALDQPTDGDWDWARNVLFESSLYDGDYVRALELSYEWLEDHPQATSSYLKIIQAYVYSGQYDNADSVLKSAMEEISTPSNRVMVLRNTAQCYRNINNYDKSLEILLQAQEIDSSQVELLFALGRIYDLLGDYENALKSNRAILNKNPSDIDAKIFWARVQLRRGEDADVVKQLQEAGKIDSTNAALLRMFGYYYMGQNQPEKALPYAERALENSGSFYSYNLLAWLKVFNEVDIDGGIDLAKIALDNPPFGNYFNRYIQESPFVPLPEHTLGVGYLKRGDYQMALGYLEKALQRRPDDEKIFGDLEFCRQRLRDSS
jgi:serine/threonine protein kinase/uncharacterized protein HemY